MGYREVRDDYFRRALEAAETGRRFDQGEIARDDEVDLDSGPGWIYFVVDNRYRHMKAGWSGNPIKRLADLQTGHPLPLKIIGIIPGSYSYEAAIHRTFHRYRTAGEWYRYSPLKSVVDELIDANGYRGAAGFASKSRNSPVETKQFRYFRFKPKG